MAGLTKHLLITAFPQIAFNPTSKSMTLTCVEQLTSQVFEIQLSGGVCEGVLAALILFQRQYGPFVVDEPTPPPGSAIN